MIGAIGAGVNLAMGVVKGLVAKGAHKRYAKQLGELEMEMPDAVLQAEGIYGDLAGKGMAGYETLMGGVDTDIASTMTGVKKAASSPTQLINALIETNVAGGQGKRDLGIKNEMAKTSSSKDLARFYSAVKAPAEQRIQQFDIDKQIAIAKEDMMGTKALMEGIEGGIGSAFSAFGAGKKMEFMGDRNEMMKEYWLKQGGDQGGDQGGGAMQPPEINSALSPEQYNEYWGPAYGAIGIG